jgi:hypothetical protein
MAKAWESIASGADFICESCGALYSVEVRHLEVQDRTVANCEVCGAVMADWNSALRLSFLLKERLRQSAIGAPSLPPGADDDGAKEGEEQPRRRGSTGIV